MSREILLDADGVVIRPRHKYFSVKFSEEHGVPIDDILPFFKGEYKRAATGEVNIRDVLPDYLSKWGWEGTVDDFLQYWYEGERDVDERVLGVVRGLRQEGARVYLASDNEAGRARYLMEEVGLQNDFDGGFFSSDLGVIKSQPEFFERVANELQVGPEHIDYWDDDPGNVEVASKSGINANVYKEFEQFKEEVSK
jgi:putative hydrolase of the HAD superfamily